jgi:multiple sugar transport system permease protein
VIPGVLAGVIWKILLIENRSGIVNYYLGQVGLGPLPLISSPILALVSVVVANVWRGCAFSMILLYAGLQRCRASCTRRRISRACRRGSGCAGC